MSEKEKIDIHPVFNQILNRDKKENLLKQRAKVIWLTGLSGAGKTTIGKNLEKSFIEEVSLLKFLMEIISALESTTTLNLR
jgi:adenylylsulfate kinase-like enzyme